VVVDRELEYVDTATLRLELPVVRENPICRQIGAIPGCSRLTRPCVFSSLSCSGSSAPSSPRAAHSPLRTWPPGHAPRVLDRSTGTRRSLWRQLVGALVVDELGGNAGTAPDSAGEAAGGAGNVRRASSASGCFATATGSPDHVAVQDARGVGTQDKGVWVHQEKMKRSAEMSAQVDRFRRSLSISSRYVAPGPGQNLG
jgi:hypothetical protein